MYNYYESAKGNMFEILRRTAVKVAHQFGSKFKIINSIDSVRSYTTVLPMLIADTQCNDLAWVSARLASLQGKDIFELPFLLGA